MNLPKFMYLLQESALFLPKMSIFEDHLEGGLTAKDYLSTSNDAAIIDIAMNGLWSAVDEEVESREKRLEQAELLRENLLNRQFETPFGSYQCDDVGRILSQCREWIYVSCWHKSPHECSAMWSLYGAENNSVCLFTTEEKLRNQLKSKNVINVIDFKDIKYLDHKSDSLDKNNLSAFFSKALPFSFEKEFRVVSYSSEKSLDIDKVNVKNGEILIIESMSNLIDKIVVSPKADSWFFESIQRLCSVYGLDSEVEESSLRTKRIMGFYEAYEQLYRNGL